jgi:protease-4
MRSFFKIFFASLLSLVVFSLIGFFIMIAVVANLVKKDRPDVPDATVLTLDLGNHFNEKEQSDPFAALSDEGNMPGLYDVIRIIGEAKDDERIAGIYVVANGNANGYASSNELRNALIDFKRSKKFVLAHGDVMSQGAYFVASAADRVYVNPVGGFDWLGFNVSLPFLKGTLDKLEIQPQIFYAGKFKSATEPFRTDKMTPENKLQTNEWLGDLYQYFLLKCSESRRIDTATLHQLANTAAIQAPQDAVTHKLVDGVKYDDEVKDEFKKRMGIGKYDKLNFISISKYAQSADFRKGGSDRIAVIYAEGDIVDGPGTSTNIGGDNFRKIIRKVRLDKSIKAIVLRVNSGGGSALASENIWRELELAKADKPVVVSFGDVAASGGYYIGCGADSIFASANTITGSIGVFGIVPNMQGFFKNKLGITFDGVKTAPYADAGAIYRPLNEQEGRIIQNSIDRIYLQFKQRVATGRKKDINYIDSIAQGRVWSGSDGLRLGLVDRIGTLQDAIACAARLAKSDTYRLREYPETKSWFEELMGKDQADPTVMMRRQMGEDQFRLFQQFQKVKEMTASPQARLPFEFFIH